MYLFLYFRVEPLLLPGNVTTYLNLCCWVHIRSCKSWKVTIFQVWTSTKLRANATNVLENTKTLFLTFGHLYIHNLVMQTTLLFFLSMFTRCEDRTKILSAAQNVLDLNNNHYFACKPNFELRHGNACKLVNSLTTWLVENWKALSCFVVVVEVIGLAVF